MGMAPKAAAQHIVSMDIDTVLCMGDSLHISAGFDTLHNVVLSLPTASISHPQITFLPDGVICDSTLGTCTYRSPITFAAFRDNAIVNSTQDIDFVRLNIEHSFMGDLLIALECPNGQFSALKYPNLPPPLDGCGDHKFDSLYGNTVGGGGRFLGEPYDLVSGNYCDPTDFANYPGIGWNYCWSEREEHNYAIPNGMIYEHQNQIYCSSIHNTTTDSTHISANLNYYRPQESFDSLIGCPLNGTWNIVVQDTWSADNGYLFDWELSFMAEMLAPTFIASVAVDGGPTLNADSTSIAVGSPVSTADTTVAYTLHIMLTNGDTLDTTFQVRWLAAFVYSETDTLCQGDTARWTSLSFTTDTLHTIRTTRVEGCDSLVTLSYTFMPSYNLHDTLPYCANEPFLYEGVDYGGPCTIVVPHQTQYGCDSTVTVHLVVIDSAFQLQLQLSSDGQQWLTDTTLYGCSPQTVYLRDTTLFEQWRLWDFGDGDTLRQEITAFQDSTPITHTYDSVGTYVVTLMAGSIHGCVDSTVRLRDAVRVFESPTANFSWEPVDIVMHDPWARFLNTSQPFDNLTYLWHFPSDDGIYTTSETSPRYEWPIGTFGDMEVRLNAIWTHAVDSNITVVCVDSVTYTVTIINEYLQFPNLVTPNGDGVNDRWVITNLLECGIYSMSELWIYDRTGASVYHVRDIKRESDFWDPSRYPDGTYFYRFIARSPYGLVRRCGVIEVVR